MNQRKTVPAPLSAFLLAVFAAVSTYAVYRFSSGGGGGYRWLCVIPAAFCLRFVLRAWNEWDDLRALKRQQQEFEAAALNKGTSRMATVAEMKAAGLGVYREGE